MEIRTIENIWRHFLLTSNYTNFLTIINNQIKIGKKKTKQAKRCIERKRIHGAQWKTSLRFLQSTPPSFGDFTGKPPNYKHSYNCNLELLGSQAWPKIYLFHDTLELVWVLDSFVWKQYDTKKAQPMESIRIRQKFCLPVTNLVTKQNLFHFSKS